jgi:hypothetical protein
MKIPSLRELRDWRAKTLYVWTEWRSTDLGHVLFEARREPLGERHEKPISRARIFDDGLEVYCPLCGQEFTASDAHLDDWGCPQGVICCPTHPDEQFDLEAKRYCICGQDADAIDLNGRHSCERCAARVEVLDLYFRNGQLQAQIVTLRGEIKYLRDALLVYEPRKRAAS